MTRPLRHGRAIRSVLTSHPYPNAHRCLDETLEQATDEQYREGLDWYRTAHDLCAKLGAIYSVHPTRVAGIVAALSPQMSWETNLQAAEAFIATDGEASVHTGLYESRARRILQDDDHPLDVLGGRKVRSFFLNITAPDACGPVTVDRHAIAILAGLTTPECNRRHGRWLERPGAYRHAAGVYRAAARRHNLLPHELQAITWVTHRARDTGPDYGDF